MGERIYLDYNATAPPDPEAIAAATGAARRWANPSSVHGSGQRARAALEDCRTRIGQRLDVDPATLFFTSGGTEALDIVLRAFPPAAMLVSAVEHEAVRARAIGAAVVPVHPTGVADMEALERLLACRPAPQLACVMHANNETGVMQPVAEAAVLAERAGARLLVDAVQTAGKLPLARADFVAVSAHKLGGPPGIGVLIVRDPGRFEPAVRAGQERGMRGGTQNLPGAAGFAAALEARARDRGWQERTRELRDLLEARVAASGLPVEIVGDRAPRLGTTSCLRLEEVPATTQLMVLDRDGIEVSAGAACSSGKVSASHVLRAMGYGEREAGAAIRVSLGWQTTAAEVERFLKSYLAMAARLAGART